MTQTILFLGMLAATPAESSVLEVPGLELRLDTSTFSASGAGDLALGVSGGVGLFLRRYLIIGLEFAVDYTSFGDRSAFGLGLGPYLKMVSNLATQRTGVFGQLGFQGGLISIDSDPTSWIGTELWGGGNFPLSSSVSLQLGPAISYRNAFDGSLSPRNEKDSISFGLKLGISFNTPQ